MYRIPGPTDLTWHLQHINDGTLNRQVSSVPGPIREDPYNNQYYSHDISNLQIIANAPNHVKSPVTISKITITNAKQIDKRNWVAVEERKNPKIQDWPPQGDCIIKVETAPQNNMAQWKQITWRGGRPIPGKPNFRRISRKKIKTYNIEASIGLSKLKIALWIFHAKLKIVTAGGLPKGAKHWREGAPFVGPKCGAVKVASFSMGENARGQVVAVAELYPRGIGKILNIKKKLLLIGRQVTAHDFVDGKKSVSKKSFKPWTEDTHIGMQAFDSSNDKLFDSDAPDLPAGAARSSETYNNFRQWVVWDGKPCSDYAYWFFQAQWKNQKVTNKKVGTGNFVLPSKAHFK